MREIKFRGIRKDNGEFVYGCLNIKHSNYVFIGNDEIGWASEWHEVIPETVGQFIGIKDVKMIDIYEGDIVEVIGTKRVGKYITEIVHHSIGFKLKLNKTSLLDYYLLPKMIEVVGNIHTTPNLLTNKPSTHEPTTK